MTENRKTDEQRLQDWKKFDRDEDKFMAIMASEMADPGSTGVGLSIDQIVHVMEPVLPSEDPSNQ